MDKEEGTAGGGAMGTTDISRFEEEDKRERLRLARKEVEEMMNGVGLGMSRASGVHRNGAPQTGNSSTGLSWWIGGGDAGRKSRLSAGV